MRYYMDPAFALNLVFIVLSCILILFSFILINRIRVLRQKIKNLRHDLSLKDQELSKKAIDVKSILKSDMEKSKSIVVSINNKHKITYVNDYACTVFGYHKEDLIGSDAFKTIYAKIDTHLSLEENIIDRIFANPQLYIEHESENTTKSGKKIWISWTNRLVYDADNNPTEVRCVGFDISQRKVLENTLNSISLLDSSTNVLNRQAFLTKSSNEMKRASDFKHPISFILIKLNCFYTTKSNTTRFSDELLLKIVHILQHSIKDTDIIGRIDHQDFAITLPETPYENASFLAEKLKEKIQEFNLKDKKTDLQLFITADIAVSYKQKKEETIDSLLQKALDKLKA